MIAGAEALLALKADVARAVTDRLYVEFPELQKFGDRGRARCLEDLHFNIDHLIPAVDLGEAPLFTTYVRWLDGLLTARGVYTSHTIRCFEIMAEILQERLDSESAAQVLPILGAGIEELKKG